MIDRNPFEMPRKEEKPKIEHLLYWVWEREAIRIAKESNYEGKLTTDPIFAKYRFCNIRRRDDKVSKWILTNVLKPRENQHDVWFAAAISRYINWPPALQALMDADAIPEHVEDFDYELFSSVVDGITKSGRKAWGGAYMQYPGKKESGIPKGLSVGKYILAPLKDQAEDIHCAIYEERSVCSSIRAMLPCYGWSEFMSGQVVADLTYIHPLDEAEDLYTHAPLGPGSQRGINRLLGKQLGHGWECEEFNTELVKIRNRITYELDMDDLTLHDVQNCMCEVDKYWRVLYGEGEPRALYRSETRF